MSSPDLYEEPREIKVMAMLHQDRAASWERLSELADNAEVARVCLNHALVHHSHRERFLSKLSTVEEAS
jgi:hypothetical protein